MQRPDQTFLTELTQRCVCGHTYAWHRYNRNEACGHPENEVGKHLEDVVYCGCGYFRERDAGDRIEEGWHA